MRPKIHANREGAERQPATLAVRYKAAAIRLSFGLPAIQIAPVDFYDYMPRYESERVFLERVGELTKHERLLLGREAPPLMVDVAPLDGIDDGTLRAWQQA